MLTANSTASSPTSRLRSGVTHIAPFRSLFYGHPGRNIPRRRQNARPEPTSLCEQAKEAFVVQSATMRNHFIFMQTFADIADHIESTDSPALDLMDITAITSPELRDLR